MEFPKVLYKGVWDPEVGLAGLQPATVTSAKEESGLLADGFVNAADVETLGAKPKAKSKGKSKEDEE